MSQVTFSIPDHLIVALNESGPEIVRDLKLEYAKRLFQDGRLTLAQAAELADLPLVEFMFRLSAAGIPVIDYSSDELKAEIARFS